MPTAKGRRAQKTGGQLKRRSRRGPRPAWVLALAHLLAAGVALVLYALPHHVLPSVQQSTGVVSTRQSIRRPVQPTAMPDIAYTEPSEAPAVDAPQAAAAPETAVEPDAGPIPGAASASDTEPAPDAEPAYEEEPVGSFRRKFADKFTDGKVIRNHYSYQSANVNVTFQRKYFDELLSRVYLVDIYVADITCLRSVLAQDKYGRGIKEWVTKVAKRTKAIATMNGDYYGSRDFGVVVRNGTLYRDKKNIRDVGVLYWDGRFETIEPKDFDTMTVMENGAYQCWHFGPRLLDDEGHAMTKFNADSRMLKTHPRSAFGYYEPGHYCFVVVDGRHEESQGVDMVKLSRLMEGLGCTAAYNLDGGQTSLLARYDNLYNRPSGGGKSASDFIIVVDDVMK